MEARRGLDLGVLGAALDLILAAALGAFLWFATNAPGDAIPRPLILAALYATPGLIALLATRGGRPALLAAGGVALIPASFLSFAGVTLPFLIPALLMLTGATRLRDSSGRWRVSPADLLIGALVVVLIVGGGWATLIGLTEPGCVATADGEHCSSAFISLRGLLVGAACIAGALTLAAWSSGFPRYGRSRFPV